MESRRRNNERLVPSKLWAETLLTQRCRDSLASPLGLGADLSANNSLSYRGNNQNILRSPLKDQAHISVTSRCSSDLILTISQMEPRFLLYFTSKRSNFMWRCDVVRCCTKLEESVPDRVMRLAR